MDQFHSTTITPERERGQHLKFEDRCSIKIFKNFADEMNALPRKHLGYSTPEELFDKFLDQVYSVGKVQWA